MTVKLAQLISYIFTPFLVLPLTLFLTALRSTNSVLKSIIYTFLFTAVSIAPSLTYVLIQIKKGKISNFHIKKREQRHEVYIIGILSALVSLVSLYLVGAPKTILVLVLALLTTGLVSFFINKKTKISLHTATTAGLSVVLYFTYGYLAGLSGLFLTFLVMWARINAGEHTLKETILGFVVGMFMILVTFLVFLS